MIKAAMAIILGLAIVAAVWWLPPWAFDLMILAVTVLGALEFSRMFFADRALRITSFAAVVATSIAMLFAPLDREFALVVMALALFVSACVVMHRSAELRGSAERLALVCLGMVYLGVALPLWSGLRALHNGNSVVLLALAPACLCDTFAYLAGKAFGRSKLAPTVSPNKTWEGFAGALVGSFAGAFLVWKLCLSFMPVVHVVALAVIIWIVSPMGDLIESMMKRSTGVKDSGTIIPGHGGMLDRLDALIFTGPAALAYMKYIAGW
jgi:phosphatidate cytidylyltransferase